MLPVDRAPSIAQHSTLRGDDSQVLLRLRRATVLHVVKAADPMGNQAAPDFLLPLWRAVVVFRVFAWIVAAGSFVREWNRYPDHVVPMVLLALMAGWTAVVTVAYGTDAGRRTRMAGYDLIVTVGFVAANGLTQSWSDLHDGAPILTSLWAAGPIFALAVERGRDGGLLGATIIGAALIAVRQRLGDQEIFNTALFLVAGVTFGYAATTTRRATTVLREALAAEGAAAERERLSRSIHDGVLQALAIVRRRGTEIGGEAADLAALAADQEVALRGLMTSGPTTAGGRIDLYATLRLRGSPRVEIVTPAGALLLDRATVHELDAAVGEALTNVTAHAGDGARAWVSAEDRGDRVVVSVRDDGGGITPTRLEEAQRTGHLGVAQSIRGRIIDLGGTVELQTSPGAGTEWELTVPMRRT
ncbi:MAG: DUF5931 domain-containing protein [Actinomycetota bacterium]|nr:DUF5931 domain-containing protein [Actinomycetota bacterium]